MMDVQALIATRRDGGLHSRAELFDFAAETARGSIPDYQISAWLMAAFLRPLTLDETVWFTEAMAASGDRIDLTGLPKPWVDKHSTGGVGDKTTIALLPLLAACGLTLVKMSGRGLGITGGTLDKLAAIPGFRTNLTPEEMKAQAAKIGLALTGQSGDLAPADKVYYALRDATTTVGSAPLIVSSVLSKKIAGGAEVIVLDVKCGSGALIEDPAGAMELARLMSDVGKKIGLKLRLTVTDMSQPLGSAVGNALEIREAIRVLRSEKLDPEEVRFRDLVIEMAVHTLLAAEKANSREQAIEMAESCVSSGRALAKMQEWFSAQGATVDVTADPNALMNAPVRLDITNEIGSGWISKVDAQTVGRNVMRLGGGRKRKEDSIDLRVGMLIHCYVGKKTSLGDPLFSVFATDAETAKKTAERTLKGIEVSATEVGETPMILAEID